jgi:hypothetical protein
MATIEIWADTIAELARIIHRRATLPSLYQNIISSEKSQ